MPVSPARARSTFSGSVTIAVRAAALEEADHRADLRAHAALREVRALGEVGLRLGQRHPVDPLLLRRPVAKRDLLDGGRDHQQLRSDHGREQRAGEILVDHRRDAAEVPVRVCDDRDPAAADRDDDEAGVHQRPDRVLLDDPERGRRRDHAPPASPRVLAHGPALLVAPPHRRRLVHERADRLRRVGEGRIVGRHLHLRDDGDGVAVDAEPAEVVLEVLRERVADRTLAVGAADVQRHLVQLGGGELGAAQDEADLRAVAVPDGHVPAVLDHRRDVPAGLAGRDVLVADALVHRVLDQRVAADRDDCAPARGHVRKPPMVSAISALPVCIRFSASSQTTECGPSITASVTSRPRSAGRQWR